MFSCDELRVALSDYLDGDLSPEVRRELEEHLRGCHTCEVLYDSTRKTLRIVSQSGFFDLPEVLSARFIQRVLSRVGR